MSHERTGPPVRAGEILAISQDQFPTLCDRVAKLDPDLGAIITAFGYPPYWSRANTFESFVWFILEQQVSLASARAALEKLRERVGTITPENVLMLDDDDMRAAYFSRQKAGYVRALAREILDGRLNLASLERLPDELVRHRLIQLKGVGNWTVDVFLILALHRADVFPKGDLAAAKALRRVKGLSASSTADELADVAQMWSPLRTVATMLLWQDYLSRRPPTSQER
jgi:DNA-3-methyladenine glycosylase II